MLARFLFPKGGEILFSAFLFVSFFFVPTSGKEKAADKFLQSDKLSFFIGNLSANRDRLRAMLSNGPLSKYGKSRKQKMEIMKRLRDRLFAKALPLQDECEEFGAGGEDVIYRLLRHEFDHVIRSVVIPHKGNYLEKDLLVIHKGVPVVIEIKHWKGQISCDPSGEHFYQEKSNGTKKTQKSPVGTTRQFIRCMKDFYKLDRYVVGMTIFSEPDCVLDLPDEIDGIRLVRGENAIRAIHDAVRKHQKDTEVLAPSRILHCVRLYSSKSEFCKGVIANESLQLYTKDGSPVLVDPDFLKYMKIEPEHLHLRDKLTILYTNGAIDEFYNRSEKISLVCLDGTCKQIAVNRLRYILF